jgi:hypothetical protein
MLVAHGIRTDSVAVFSLLGFARCQGERQAAGGRVTGAANFYSFPKRLRRTCGPAMSSSAAFRTPEKARLMFCFANLESLDRDYFLDFQTASMNWRNCMLRDFA